MPDKLPIPDVPLIPDKPPILLKDVVPNPLPPNEGKFVLNEGLLKPFIGPNECIVAIIGIGCMKFAIIFG
jgi:hypothetical protein